MKTDVLGVKIDDINLEEALAVVEKWILSPGKSFGKAQDRYYIVTPNPEFIIAAQKDMMFKKILNGADLSLSDGIGLRFSGKVKNTVSGTDFMEKLVRLAAEKGFIVGFLGGRNKVAKKTAERLLRRYPRLKVAFAESGGEVDQDGQWHSSSGRKAPLASPKRSLLVRFASNKSSDIVSNVRSTSPIALTDSDFAIPPLDILFVAFGHIKQEKWIAANLDKILVKVAMGVGGAFDYLSGSVHRAPKWMRDLGFEWLFRLIIQPWRLKRQLVLLKYLWLIMVK